MEFAMSMTRSLWLLLPIMLAMSAVGQDVNFGRKVKCYVRDGTVLCPGCNSRQGLSCPRNRKMESCNVKTEIPYSENESNQTVMNEDGIETATVQGSPKPSKTTPFQPESNPNDVQQEEIDWDKMLEDPEFRYFIYQLLKPLEKRRKIREVPMQDMDDTCEWNGDCPCPLICCKTGEGCPKRCMSGIRLPPPWG